MTNRYRDYAEDQNTLGTPDDPELRFYQVLLDVTPVLRPRRTDLVADWKLR